MIGSRSTRSVGHVALAIAIALGFGGTVASSQTMPELQPGMRVWIRAPGIVDGRVTGKIASRTAESIVVVGDRGGEFPVPFAAMSELRLSRGISHTAGAVKGAMWGGGFGLGVGLMFAAALHSHSQSGLGLGPPTAEESILIGTGSGLAIGLALGTLSGSEQWERLRLPPTVAVIPVPRGLGVRFDLTR